MPLESHMSRATVEGYAPAAGAAVVQDTALGQSPVTGRVNAVVLVSEALVALNAGNYRTFRLINKGQAGAGTTVVATFTTQATNLPQFNDQDMTLSATASDLQVTAGDVLVLDETVTGTGVAHSGVKAIVEVIH